MIAQHQGAADAYKHVAQDVLSLHASGNTHIRPSGTAEQSQRALCGQSQIIARTNRKEAATRSH